MRKRKISDEEWEMSEHRLIYNSGRMYQILLIGAIVLCIYFVGVTLFLKTTRETEFEPGLDISYTGSAIWIKCEGVGASSMIATIFMDSENYRVYEKEFKRFPISSEYITYNKNAKYMVTVTLVKESGNYTYYKVIEPYNSDTIEGKISAWINTIGLTNDK